MERHEEDIEGEYTTIEVRTEDVEDNTPSQQIYREEPTQPRFHFYQRGCGCSGCLIPLLLFIFAILLLLSR